MVGPTLEYIVWLMFFKYSFQKIISYVPCSNQDFENSWEGIFKEKWYVHNIFTTNLKWQVVIVGLKK